MTHETPIVAVHSPASRLTPQQALRVAWVTWIALLLVPYAILPFTLYFNIRNAAVRNKPDLADAWFLIIMLYLLLAVPAAFFWRSHLFKAYWRGETVTPRAYLSGMLTLWAALTIGGATAMIVCMATATLTPNVAPALIALFIFLLLWPDGSAMTSHLGASDDAELYTEPR
jgi:hypothetical protein